jgi:rhamnosyltransferase
MEGEIPLVAVIIPVKNGAATIKACLEALLSQTIAGNVEIIVIDSGSTDGTRDIIRLFPVELILIDPQSFNHGLTRNEGLKRAKGEFVYFTVQDARLAAKDSLAKMLVHFQDPEVMCVSGTQAVPHEQDKNPVYWYRPISAPTISRAQFSSPADFNNLPPRQQQQLSVVDNVNSMYRRTALEALPFVRTDFAEDMNWGKMALQKGWAIIYDTGVYTWHYHHMDFSYSFRSSFIIHYSKYLYFGLLPGYSSFYRSMRVTVGALLKTNSIGWKSRIYWFAHTIIAYFGEVYATWIFRRAARGQDREEVNKAYARYCKQVPQGRQKESVKIR